MRSMNNDPQKRRQTTTAATRSYSFVHLEFGSAHRSSSLALLALLARRIPATHRRLIVVDNAGAPMPLAAFAPFDEVILLKGDNANREFSGWDVAAAWLKNDPAWVSDSYVFSNDTVARHRGFGIGRKLRFVRAFAQLPDHDDPVVCGEIDGLAAPVEMPWGRHAFYASTYLFGMNRAAFELLTPFCALKEQIDALLAPCWPADSLFTAAMPQSYAQHLTRWLHEPGGWYAARPLSASNFTSMKAKATCILLEHSLSARLTAARGKLISIYAGKNRLEHVLGMLADRYERRWKVPTRRQQLQRYMSDFARMRDE